MDLVAVAELSVRYGRRLVLDRVSLAVPEGSVYVLLGRNGAGKSSLVRCLLGEQRPESGRASLLGRDAWRERARRDKMAHVRLDLAPDRPGVGRVDAQAAAHRVYVTSSTAGRRYALTIINVLEMRLLLSVTRTHLL
jgi:ABC-type cobalamin/Fe3+-siderophores transport system ATPase subunit